MPAVSILMTAYNREQYIAEAIESVLASSFPDFELIIVDDSSTDGTFKIAKDYEWDKRVRIFRNPKNLGQFANRNHAASLASGTYLKFLDSDDILYPHSLAIMMEAMLQYPEAGIGVGEKYRDSDKPYPYCLSSGEALCRHYLQQELLMIGPSGTIIKRSAFEEAKGFENYGMPSDNHLTLKIVSKHPVVMLQRDLFWWRVHRGQVFQQTVHQPENILNNYAFNRNIVTAHSSLNENLSRKILFNQKKIFYRNLLRLILRQREPISALNLYRQFRRMTHAS